MDASVAIFGEIRCAGCSRAPLVGESAILHAGRGRHGRAKWLCELCEAEDGLSGRAGVAVERTRIHSEGATHVRLLA